MIPTIIKSTPTIGYILTKLFVVPKISNTPIITLPTDKVITPQL